MIKLCECGCGQEVKKGNRYINGHNWKGKERPEFSYDHRLKISESQKGEKNINYGKPRTEEVRKKISKSNRGQLRSEEAKRKMSESHMGKTWEEVYGIEKAKELKESRRNNFLGEKNPMKKIEVREKVSSKMSGENNPMKRPESIIRMSGENNPSWNGGSSFGNYCAIFSIKEFKEIILERDNYKCLNPYCNKKSNMLNIHHIDYDKKNCDLKNLICICTSCNIKANSDREWHKAWYKAIIERRYGKI